jgi:hypothetical protein
MFITFEKFNHLLASLNIIDKSQEQFEKIEFDYFTDQDGYKHLIIKGTNSELLSTIYSSFYGKGNLCHNRSAKFIKRQKDLGFEGIKEIDEITIASITAVLHNYNSYTARDMAYVMSFILGWLDDDIIPYK